MISRKLSTRAVMPLCIVAALVVLALLAGCGSGTKSGSSQAKGTTAKASLTVARSSLSTMAPDARLLLVQTMQSVTTTSTPVWVYLFGSPKTDKTYMVAVSNGRVMQSGEYGTAGLTAQEWKNVPQNPELNVDSDQALQKAVTAGKQPANSPYTMAIATYIPSRSATQSAQALTWYVYFGENAQSVVEVNAKTGQVIKK